MVIGKSDRNGLSGCTSRLVRNLESRAWNSEIGKHEKRNNEKTDGATESQSGQSMEVSNGSAKDGEITET